MVCAVAVHPIADWSESEAAWSALVLRIMEGSEPAMTELYDRTNRMVYGLALRILGDPGSAEDVTLEVYLQVWRTAVSYDPRRGRVSSWLVTLTRSRSIDALRSRHAQRAALQQPIDEISEPQDLRGDPEQSSIQTTKAKMIRKFVGYLPPDQRRAIELAYFAGLSHSEIASRTGLPLGTIKTRIRLGMVRLRELLSPYAEGL